MNNECGVFFLCVYWAACIHTLLWGSANILVKISHSLFNSTRLQRGRKKKRVKLKTKNSWIYLLKTRVCSLTHLSVRWFFSRACRPNKPSFLSDQLELAQRLSTWKLFQIQAAKHTKTSAIIHTEATGFQGSTELNKRSKSKLRNWTRTQ